MQTICTRLLAGDLLSPVLMAGKSGDLLRTCTRLLAADLLNPVLIPAKVGRLGNCSCVALLPTSM